MIVTKNKLLMLTLLGGIASISLLPEKAFAWATSADVANSTSNVNSVTRDEAKKTQDAINTASNQIVAAIQELSKQNTTNTAGATNAIANMKDVEDQRRVTMAIQKEKIAATNAATSGASNCNAITGAAATQNLENLVQRWSINGAHAILAHNQGIIDDSKKIVTPETIRSTYSQTHCENNATATDIALGRCKQYNVSTVTQTKSATSTGSSGIADVADDQNASLFLNNDIMDDKQADAMGRFLSLTTDAQAPGQAAIPNVNNSADREKLFYNLDSLRAMRSISSSIMTGLIGQTKVVKTSGGETQKLATQWANATAGQMAGYTPDSSGVIFANGVSELAADAIKSKYWYYNLNYQVYSAAEGQAAAAKDLNSMIAWNTVLNYKKYQQLRNINASLAAILTLKIDEHQKDLLKSY